MYTINRYIKNQLNLYEYTRQLSAHNAQEVETRTLPTSQDKQITLSPDWEHVKQLLMQSVH